MKKKPNETLKKLYYNYGNDFFCGKATATKKLNENFKEQYVHLYVCMEKFCVNIMSVCERL